jgi:hypothetical protein
MFVLTPLKSMVTTEKDLAAAFEKHRDFGPSRCIQLHRDDGSYLSAVGEGFGPYMLEWFPVERNGFHLRAVDDLKSQEVQNSLLDFLRGGSAWRESNTWREVEDEKPPWLSRLWSRIQRAED